MEVFERVVTSGAATCPLTDNGEGRMGACNGDDLAERFGGTRFEGDILDSKFLEACDPLKLEIELQGITNRRRLREREHQPR